MWRGTKGLAGQVDWFEGDMVVRDLCGFWDEARVVARMNPAERLARGSGRRSGRMTVGTIEVELDYGV